MLPRQERAPGPWCDLRRRAAARSTQLRMTRALTKGFLKLTPHFYQRGEKRAQHHLMKISRLGLSDGDVYHIRPLRLPLDGTEPVAFREPVHMLT